jgi:energy-converting hydrogenase Eha subunit A
MVRQGYARACHVTGTEGLGRRETMVEFHRYLGEGLFLIYLIVIGIVLYMGRRNRKVPGAVIGTAHGLLAIQVAVGLILFAEEPGRIVWYHPVIGLLAMLSLGLTPVLRKRFGPQGGMAAGLGVVAALALVAMLVAMSA